MNTIARKPWVRVKVCGITTVSCAQAVEDAGADALGLVFYPNSPRYVSLQAATAIAQSVGPLISVVALFVDPDVGLVNDVIEHVGVNVLQFHGNEPASFCEQFSIPYIKAVRLEHDGSLEELAHRHPRSRGFLVDAYVPGIMGGTGVVADWSAIPSGFDLPLVLAGGLTPENVAGAIVETGVRAVDVSSGVEAEPGKKSATKIQAFMEGARGA